MTLPFLKNRGDDGVGQGPTETLQRKPDEDRDYDMLDAVAEDIMSALKSGNVRLLREALGSLCDHIQMLDQEQDETQEPAT